jgi:hypothetical protein
MTPGEVEDRILETLGREYLRTGKVDWWAIGDLCLAAGAPEEFFGPAVEAMIPRLVVEAKVDQKGGQCVRLGRAGISRVEKAPERLR